MNQPPLDILMDVVKNKYALVVLTARRARQLAEVQELNPAIRSMKPVSIALREIANGKITYQVGGGNKRSR